MNRAILSGTREAVRESVKYNFLGSFMVNKRKCWFCVYQRQCLLPLNLVVFVPPSLKKKDGLCLSFTCAVMPLRHSGLEALGGLLTDFNRREYLPQTKPAY